MRPPGLLRAAVAAGLVLVVCAGAALGAGPEKTAASPPAPGVTLPPDVGKTFQVEAGKVKAELAKEAASVFKRQPLGFDVDTLAEVRDWILSLPARIPALAESVSRHLRVLGVIGTLVILAFLGVIFYSLVGWKRVLTVLENRAQPWREHLSHLWYPLVLSGLRILAATLIPLLIFGLYCLIRALIDYNAPWFVLTG